MRLTESMLDAVLSGHQSCSRRTLRSVAVDERLNLSGSLPAVDKLSLGLPEGGALALGALAIVWL